MILQLIIAVVGLRMYALCANPKLSEVGKNNVLDWTLVVPPGKRDSSRSISTSLIRASSDPDHVPDGARRLVRMHHIATRKLREDRRLAFG